MGDPSDLQQQSKDGKRRAVVSLSIAVLFVCIANPDFAAASAGGISMLRIQYPGVVLGFLVLGSAYAWWRFRIATIADRSRLEAAVLKRLANSPRFIQRFQVWISRNDAVRELYLDEELPSPPMPDRSPEVRDHWLSTECLSTKQLVIDNGRTLTIPRIPRLNQWKSPTSPKGLSFWTEEASERIEIHPTKSDSHPGATTHRHQIEVDPMPITMGLRWAKQMSYLKEVQEGEIYSDTVFPTVLFGLAAWAVASELLAVLVAGLVLGRCPITEGLLIDILSTLQNL